MKKELSGKRWLMNLTGVIPLLLMGACLNQSRADITCVSGAANCTASATFIDLGVTVSKSDPVSGCGGLSSGQSVTAMETKTGGGVCPQGQDPILATGAPSGSISLGGVGGDGEWGG